MRFPEIRPFSMLRQSDILLQKDRPFRLEERYPNWVAEVRDAVPEAVLRDWVGIRMLCTYYGPGTEWIPEAFANRAGLGQGDNEKVVLDFSQVRRNSRGPSDR